MDNNSGRSKPGSIILNGVLVLSENGLPNEGCLKIYGAYVRASLWRRIVAYLLEFMMVDRPPLLKEQNRFKLP
jgi:hypothetical protein